MLTCLPMRQVSTCSTSDEQFMNFSLPYHEPCKYLKRCKYLPHWAQLRCIIALALYSVGNLFEPRAGYRLPRMRFIMVSQTNVGEYFETCQYSRLKSECLLIYDCIPILHSTIHNTAVEITPVRNIKSIFQSVYIYIYIYHYYLKLQTSIDAFCMLRLLASWGWSKSSTPL
jgi:hypothetical protein